MKNHIKIIALLLALIMAAVVLVSCGDGENEETLSIEEKANEGLDTFVWVANLSNSLHVSYYRDTVTGVMYITNTRNGTMTPLYDTDGSPVVYEEFVERYLGGETK